MDPYYKEKLEEIADELGLPDLTKQDGPFQSTDTVFDKRYKKINEEIKRKLQEVATKINDSTNGSSSRSNTEILKQLDKLPI
jgi:hypothetical protein